MLTARIVHMIDSLNEDVKPAVVEAQAVPAASPADTVHVPE